MATLNRVETRSSTYIPEPGLARFLFGDTRFAWFWLIVRLYVGYEWLASGVSKVFGISINIDSFGQSTSSWVFTSGGGSAIQGFIKGAFSKTGGPHPDVTAWYAWFLQTIVSPNATTFAYVISFGELTVGIALILGLLTGIAAFFGLFMNVNYLLAGTVSSNPVLAILGSLIMLAWRIAGYYGIDRWLLPLLGTPWSEGQLSRRRARVEAPRDTTARTGDF